MLIDINHFIEKDKKPPRHFIPRELFNYEPPSPVKLKDIETADEYLAAYRFYKRNFNITDDVLLKAMVTYAILSRAIRECEPLGRAQI